MRFLLASTGLLLALACAGVAGTEPAPREAAPWDAEEAWLVDFPEDVVAGGALQAEVYAVVDDDLETAVALSGSMWLQYCWNKCPGHLLVVADGAPATYRWRSWSRKDDFQAGEWQSGRLGEPMKTPSSMAAVELDLGDRPVQVREVRLLRPDRRKVGRGTDRSPPALDGRWSLRGPSRPTDDGPSAGLSIVDGCTGSLLRGEEVWALTPGKTGSCRVEGEQLVVEGANVVVRPRSDAGGGRERKAANQSFRVPIRRVGRCYAEIDAFVYGPADECHRAATRADWGP